MSKLINRNVQQGDRRTSMRLEPEMWDALRELCEREDVTLKDWLTALDPQQDRTAAVRAAVLTYYRVAATEAGHAAAGHGPAGGRVR